MATDDTSGITTKQVLMPPNPSGKGGFGEHPENRSNGGWKKENTISYQYKRFLNMSPDQLKEFGKTPDKERTVAMDIAYSQVLASRKSLPHAKEITDRTEGRAQQSIEHTGKDGSPIETSTTVTYVPKQLPDKYWEADASNDV